MDRARHKMHASKNSRQLLIIAVEVNLYIASGSIQHLADLLPGHSDELSAACISGILGFRRQCNEMPSPLELLGAGSVDDLYSKLAEADLQLLCGYAYKPTFDVQLRKSCMCSVRRMTTARCKTDTAIPCLKRGSKMKRTVAC